MEFAAATVGFVSLSLQLLGGCVKGFVLLTTAHNLGKDASTIVCMLNLQEGQLIEWAKRAGLLTGDGSLDRRLNPAAVEETLRQIEQLLQNTETLKTRYNLSLVQQKPEGYRTTAVQDLNSSEKSIVFNGISQATRDEILERAGVAQKTNFAKRLWWAAVDKEKIERLVADVHFLVRELWNLVNPLQHDDFMNSVLSRFIQVETSFEQLIAIKDSLAAIQGKLETRDQQNLRGLATTAELKAVQAALAPNDDPNETISQETIPKRQEILPKLERLSRLKLKSTIEPAKKNETRGLAVYDGASVFIEWKHVDPTMRSKILPRAENLAALLSIPKANTFRSLTCKGLLEDDQRLGFVYQNPSMNSSPEEPKSLLDLFSAKGGIEPPSLSDRVRLALRVAQVVQNFHRTGWLHKGLRSENILFFDASDMSVAVRNTDFVLAGFNFARFGAPTEMSEKPSADPRHDVYRHPDALGQPLVSFSEVMDVYSLGTILLEIAEWRALRYLVERVVDVSAAGVPLDKLAAVRQFLLDGKGKGGTSKLRSKMGDIYTSACLMCLSGTVAESEPQGADESVQGNVLDDVVRRLQSCHV